MSSEPGASFISKIKDSLQMIMYITAITGTTLAGVIKGCGLISSDDEPKQEAVAGQEQDDAEIKAAPKPAVKPKAAAKVAPAAVNEPKAEVKNEPEPAKNEPVKKVSGTVQNSRSETKAKPAPEPAKPAEPVYKPMTEKEREEFAGEKKAEMKDTGKELNQRQEEKDPAGKSSNVKKEERKKIENDEDDFRKKMRERFKEQKEDDPAKNE